MTQPKNHPARKTRGTIRALLKADPNMKVRDIARALDLSTQRVYKHLNAIEAEGNGPADVNDGAAPEPTEVQAS